MRNSLFGFIELFLLISLRLFYRTFPEITTWRRKANLGKTRAESFSVYSVLYDPRSASLIKLIRKGRSRAQRGLSYFDFGFQRTKKVKNFLKRA